MRNYGLKALLCTRMGFPNTTCELEINQVVMGGTIRNEQRSSKAQISLSITRAASSMPKKLEVSQRLMNLAIPRWPTL